MLERERKELQKDSSLQVGAYPRQTSVESAVLWPSGLERGLLFCRGVVNGEQNQNVSSIASEIGCVVMQMDALSDALEAAQSGLKRAEQQFAAKEQRLKQEIQVSCA
eukprot:2195956-Rhodomonas_salina.3